MLDRVQWNISGGRVLGPAPFFVVGIINVTPDSFYDGGEHDSPEAAFELGKQMVRDGAMVLDVGGESTRPSAEYVSAQKELGRVLPVVKNLAGFLTDENEEAAISIDTYKAEVAAKCLDAGATIINDVSACQAEPELLDVLGQYQPGYVLMHSQGCPKSMQNSPHYSSVVDEILEFFEERLRAVVMAGLPEDNIVIDPGIGFGKTLENNLEILSNIEAFGVLGFPIFMGLSNKSMFQRLLGLEVKDRCQVTQAATAVLASRGVRIHRVHDVAATMQTLAVAEAMRPSRRVRAARGGAGL